MHERSSRDWKTKSENEQRGYCTMPNCSLIPFSGNNYADNAMINWESRRKMHFCWYYSQWYVYWWMDWMRPLLFVVYMWGGGKQILEMCFAVSQHHSNYVICYNPSLKIPMWNFTFLGLPFSKYSAILAKSPPKKIPAKFCLLRKVWWNSICSGLGLNSNLPEIPPCVWCTTEWHHTNTKRKSRSLVWMMQSHAMSNFR